MKETNLTKSVYLVDACWSRHVSVKVHFWKVLIVRNRYSCSFVESVGHGEGTFLKCLFVSSWVLPICL